MGRCLRTKDNEVLLKEKHNAALLNDKRKRGVDKGQ